MIEVFEAVHPGGAGLKVPVMVVFKLLKFVLTELTVVPNSRATIFLRQIQKAESVVVFHIGNIIYLVNETLQVYIKNTLRASPATAHGRYQLQHMAVTSYSTWPLPTQKEYLYSSNLFKLSLFKCSLVSILPVYNPALEA